MVDPCKQLSVKLDYGTITTENFKARYQHSTAIVTDATVMEYLRLEKDRRFFQKLVLLPEGFLESVDDGYVRLPIDIDRIVLDAQVKFQCGTFAFCKREPYLTFLAGTFAFCKREP